MANGQLTPTMIVVIVLFVIVGFFAFSRCKMSCTSKEGLSHRLTMNTLLKDHAYERGYKTPYTQKWDYNLGQKENYTDAFKCNQYCNNVMGATPNAKCQQDCMNASLGSTTMQQMTEKCSSDEECGPGMLCVNPGPYTGGSHGYCMSDNEPGIPRGALPSLRREKESFGCPKGTIRVSPTQCVPDKYDPLVPLVPPGKEGFSLPKTCSPESFFNEVAGRCEPRFQGVASARAVMMDRPGPAPDVSLPGSTMPGFGVGYMDPVNVPVRLGRRGPELQLVTDQ